ncbi:major facilitator superfamily MFS_1 [Segniliparus rotundus DSM 44985]|uniref:Major facilitator superfamily MFS_1 n=1 Tax=Segniliparus rotundus (strain ATCC BAA-972 / CDC 1076 / CIP 108378 / DSM 44985 / JCM 13578) TaxID=640132 RepID=D6Z8A1_SEGRD|nr:MFS transporter [Segniliparus rotundus]ADG98181.1 major facilitator superfamily MFS_1 [Segniliparus rotundus DSM 44985]
MPELFTRAATAGACAAMVGVGALLAVYGPALPEWKAQFGLSDAAAGSGLALQSLGAVVGAVAVQPVLRRRGNRFALAASLSLVVVGSVVIALAPSWGLTLAGAVVAGLGLGGCDALVTQLFLIGHGERGPALVNIAHACFGIGTVAAPALVAVVGSGRYRWVFVGVGVICLVGLATLRGVRPRPTPGESARDAARSERLSGSALAVVGGFLVLYIAHFAVQSGIGSWEPVRLLDLGHSPAVAGLATSGYWLAMVIGRFLAAPLAHRVSAAALVIASAAGMTAAVALACYGPATVWAYLLAGLFIGPIFPNGLTWLAQTGYAHGPAFAYIVAAAMAGAVVCPPLLGALVGAHGAGALAPALLSGSVIAMSGALAAWASSRSSSSGPTV